jgi:hypothetical protein
MTMNKKKGKKNLFLDIIRQLELKKPKDKLREKVKKRKNKKKVNEEISDKVQDIKTNFKEFKKEKILYSILIEESKGLDYSKLQYGKIAEPLAINWNYDNYQNVNQSEFSSEETLNNEAIDKIIEEEVINAKFHISTTNISVDAKERFKYFKLFNKSLVEMKYELAFN